MTDSQRAEGAEVERGDEPADGPKLVHLTANGARALNWAMDTLRDEGRALTKEAVAYFLANIFADIAPHVSTAMIEDIYRRSLRDGPTEQFKRRA